MGGLSMKKILFFISLCAMTLAIAQSAQAAGIGVYGTGGVNLDTISYRGATANSTDYFYGGGLAIDSNVARNELFGYRFTLGYEQYRMKASNSDYTSDPIHRISMSHTFGFGVARNETVRFWLGPRIGIHYLFIRKTDTGWTTQVTEKTDFIGLDALLALGLNINMGDVATLFFDIGFGYMGNYDLHSSGIGNGFGLDGKIGFMFRINDKFKG
jgi:hypothetical protein